MVELHWTEVDGVATVWSEAPGPLRAGLLFRTGQVDETLVTSGQTHLIEHLVLSAISSFPQTSNGYTYGPVTGFLTMGDCEDVSAFFRSVCTTLQSLPAERLESEKRILAAEAASKHHNVNSHLLMMRYGATGYGLIGMPELGIQGATSGQLHEWSKQRFTSGNAVLWMSGPPPTDLHLVLPPGEKQPIPPLTPTLPTFPCWFVDNQCGGIAAGTTVPRVATSSLFCQIASRRIHDRLRSETALSYAPSITYDPLDADTAHLVFYADSQPDHRIELAKVFSQFFESLTKIFVDEVDSARKLYCDSLTGLLAPPPSERVFYELQRAAMSWIFGREFESNELLAEEASTVKITDVAEFGVEMQKSAIFAIPGGAIIQPCMGKQVPASGGVSVDGREVASVDAPIQPERLVSGPDGVSIVWPNCSHVTVRYTELAAALYYDDGCIGLINSNGTYINVEPTLWRHGPSVCQEIRERIPEHLLIEQGARSADAIPKPKTTLWQRFCASLKQYSRTSGVARILITFGILFLLNLILSLISNPR